MIYHKVIFILFILDRTSTRLNWGVTWCKLSYSVLSYSKRFSCNVEHQVLSTSNLSNFLSIYIQATKSVLNKWKDKCHQKIVQLSSITWLLTLLFGFHEVLGSWPTLVTVLLAILTWYPSLLNVVYTMLLLTNQVRGVRKWSCRKHRLCWEMSQNLWFSWRQHKQMSVLRLGRSLFRSLLKRLPDLKGRFLYYLLQPSLFASSVLFCRIRHNLVRQHICDVSSVSTYNKRVSLNKLNLQFVQCFNADQTLLLPFNLSSNVDRPVFIRYLNRKKD